MKQSPGAYRGKRNYPASRALENSLAAVDPVVRQVIVFLSQLLAMYLTQIKGSWRVSTSQLRKARQRNAVRHHDGRQKIVEVVLLVFWFVPTHLHETSYRSLVRGPGCT